MSDGTLLDWRSMLVEQTGSQAGHCDCCGRRTQVVWGSVSLRHSCLAVFFLQWIGDAPEHGADIQLIMGDWSETSTNKDRFLVQAHFFIDAGQPNFMVVDADRSTVEKSLCRDRLKREDVIGTPIATGVFAMLDAIYGSESAAGIRAWTPTLPLA
jgi:hypothetical protein